MILKPGRKRRLSFWDYILRCAIPILIIVIILAFVWMVGWVLAEPTP